jgi:hypothetical protein
MVGGVEKRGVGKRVYVNGNLRYICVIGHS